MKTLLKNTLYLFLLVITVSPSFGQGKLMLIGGGSEKDTDYSWSNTPYQWAVDQSSNKKVAIIAFGESSDPQWLPDYFMKLGASQAKNFIINTTDSAQSTITYDTLMHYDVFFFKGGDQYNYYSTYKNSKVSEAIKDKFNEGGVIAGTSAGMAILSGVMYTAANGSLYPDQALKNVYNANITLADDFLNLLPGYIGDTHFIERGRMPRLMAFMANWFFNHGEMLTGIGVDDRTAFCIDQNKIGHAYGTGAVNIVSAESFAEEDGMLTTDSIHTTALLHGQTYNLNTQSIESTLSEDIASSLNENGNYTVYLSGSELVNDNQELLQKLANDFDEALLITETENSAVSDYEEALTDLQISSKVITTSQFADSCASALSRNLIKQSHLVILLNSNIKNDQNTSTGQLLINHLKRDDITSVFLGEEAKIAGSYYVDNNTDDPLNAYYGDLSFTQGLGILTATTIIPDAYDPSSSDFYENNTAAVQYALINKKLKYGLLINKGSYVKYGPNEGLGQFTSAGEYVSLLITNIGTLGDLASQPVDANGNTRNVVGYDQLQWSWLHHTAQSTANIEPIESESYTFELTPPAELTAELSGGQVTLEWSNTSDLATTIRVESSETNDDFSLLTTLPADKTNFTESLTKDEPVRYYRLQATEGDKKSCYSDIASVALVTATLTKLKGNIILYPNPVTSQKLYIQSPLPTSVTIYNQLGKRMIKKKIDQEKYELDLSSLANGVYQLIFNNNKMQETKQIFVFNGY